MFRRKIGRNQCNNNGNGVQNRYCRFFNWPIAIETWNQQKIFENYILILPSNCLSNLLHFAGLFLTLNFSKNLNQLDKFFHCCHSNKKGDFLRFDFFLLQNILNCIRLMCIFQKNWSKISNMSAFYMETKICQYMRTQK